MAFPAVIDTDTSPSECFPVIQHRRAQPQIICILSRAAPSGVTASETCVQFPATALAIGLVVSYSCFVPLGEKSKSTELTSLEQWCGFQYVRTYTGCGRFVGRPQCDHAGGATRSFRGLKNFTAGIIVMTRAASYSSRFSLIPRRPCSPSSHSAFIPFSLFLSRSRGLSFSFRPARGARRCRD